jgi:type II secretory ATPase GspE/PulE/Tfp pilus assembly ATPase PilB-like protein
MIQSLTDHVDALLATADVEDESYAAAIVDGILSASAILGASDVHLQPTPDGLALKWRIDGVLQPAGVLPRTKAANVLARLKVLAGLLTYRTETPQEGRIRDEERGLEFRVSTFPTLHGEKAVVRVLTTQQNSFERFSDLDFDSQTEVRLRAAASATSGAILLVGPAGSGKTTTAYAVLRAARGGRNVASLEDPIEAVVDGVAQTQINPAAGLDLLTALRSLLRQDPEVILVGEIRDAGVARVAYQAAMTGQLVVTTFHASDAADALVRLLDMGIPPYVVRGATRLVVAQRLVRRACTNCDAARPWPEPEVDHAIEEGERNYGTTPGDALVGGTGVEASHACQACRGTGYCGRIPVAEAVELEGPEIAEAVLACADASRLRKLFADAGYRSLLEKARALLARRETTRSELVRVFGLAALESGHAH